MSEYDKTHILHPVNEASLITSILDQYRANGDKINQAVDDNDRKTRSVMFSVSISKKDDGAPEFFTKMRTVVTDPLRDSRRVKAEDPDAIPMPGGFLAEADANSKEALKKKAENPNLSMAEAPKKTKKAKK